MRSVGNFHPEWGYLAPAPTFMRTVRIALVASAVGASAGAAVVFSLAARPAGETSVAARTLVQPVKAATASTDKPPAAHVALQASSEQPPARTSPTVKPSGNAVAAALATSEASTSSSGQQPSSAAALAELPAADGPAPVKSVGASAPLRVSQALARAETPATKPPGGASPLQTAADPAPAAAPPPEKPAAPRKAARRVRPSQRYASREAGQDPLGLFDDRAGYARADQYYQGGGYGGYYREGRWGGYYGDGRYSYR